MFKRFITHLVLRSVASNLDHLVSFLERLDAKVNEYIAAQNAEAQTHIDAVVDAEGDLEARIHELKAEFEESKAALLAKAHAAVQRAEIALGLRRKA